MPIRSASPALINSPYQRHWLSAMGDFSVQKANRRSDVRRQRAISLPYICCCCRHAFVAHCAIEVGGRPSRFFPSSYKRYRTRTIPWALVTFDLERYACAHTNFYRCLPSLPSLFSRVLFPSIVSPLFHVSDVGRIAPFSK